MQKVRLPSYIKPERYQILMKPNLEGFTFEGEEAIFLKLEKSVKEITLHAKELKIYDVTYHAAYSTQRGKIFYDIKAETATFSFSSALPKGKGKLKLSFKGILNDKMRGFYRSRYIHQGKEKHMATTQFEATDARRALPCFDEPAQKAVFDVTLMVPKGLTAISNTIESQITEHGSGYQVVKFTPTPKMSTYLLAFIIGDFEFIEGRTRNHAETTANAESRGKKTSNGTLVRVFVTPGKKHQAKFALTTAIKMLEFYNKYFNIPYPLPVLDLIAIPDFSHGAMENWGAVTYRESALLVDPQNSSAANKQWVALVIAHELAHQWFGNLVTMEWWTHLWLNEGFASYIEYLATNHVFPKWDIWTQFAAHDLNPALELDALKHTHPIEIEVGHPDEIGEIFDEISYSKGASVIRMLAGFLGEKNFRDGLRYYLKKHSYKNASTVNLWEAFEKVSKKPVKKLMQNWTGKAGYPLVKITQLPKALKFSQSRFFASPVSKKQTKDNTVWQVPIKVQGSRFKGQDILLQGKQTNFIAPKSEWVKVNIGESGFFRVDYPAPMLGSLAQAVKSKNLSALDRLGIIRDAFALAQAGDLPTTVALNLAKSYNNEDNYTVWVQLAYGLADLRSLLSGEKHYPKFEKFATGVFEKIGLTLGFRPKAGESHTQSLLRSLVLSQLIALNHKPTIKKALKIYSSGKIPADIRAVVYQAAAQTGSAKIYNRFLKAYAQETLSEEKNRIGRALGQFTNFGLFNKTLKFALSNSVRIQDTFGIFASVWANPKGRQIAWDFTRKNWKVLLKRYPSSGHMLTRFIKPAGNFATIKKAEEVKSFFKKHGAPGAERAVEQTLEKIYCQAAWLLRDAEKIENWLK